MKDYHLTVLVIGFGLAYGILYLVRRDHLYIRQGVFWIVIALLVRPQLRDDAAAPAGPATPGISTPPTA